MNKKSIREKYLKKIDLFKKFNKQYYIDSNPSINDDEYDNLKKEI